MKSLRLTEKQKLSFYSESISPEAGDGEIMLHVEYCGICRTDAKMWAEGQRDLRMPRILGHEFCGTAPDGRKFVVWPAKSCGKCEQCRSGHENLCREIEIIGFHRDGAMAEFVSVPEESLIELPCKLSGKFAIFAEPAACGINALNQMGIHSPEKECELRNPSPRKRLLIIGGGTCGLLLALTAEESGLDVLVIENSQEKIRKSKDFITKTGIAISDTFPSEAAFDYCINAAASTDSLTQGLKLLKPGAEFCIFSGLSKDDSVPAVVVNEIHYRQLTLSGAYGCTKKQMQQALEIIGRRDEAVETLIEDIIKLEDTEKVMPAVFAGKNFRYIIKE